MGEHCSLGSIVKPTADSETTLDLELESKPFANPHLWTKGKYRLKLQIVGANARPVERTLEVTINGLWFDDTAKMFSDGIGLKFM
jgi:hypothetical protein